MKSFETIALIGSFREKNYPKVQRVLAAFISAGLRVLSPSGKAIVSGHNFVRFESDSSYLSDAQIQTATLLKIFSADAVYVVTADQGYIGRTTCYEIGRVIQRRQPIYFDAKPDDVPVEIPSEYVVEPERFVLRFVHQREALSWLYTAGSGELFDGERCLASNSGPAADPAE